MGLKFQTWRTVGTETPRTADGGLVNALLKSRGLEGKRAELVDCPAGMIHDPLELMDMEIGAARVRRAIASKEHVAVFGDYDADGVTSTCLLASYLESKGLSPDVHIPDRLEDDYGLSPEPLRALAEKGVTLVITVDCGITAVEEAVLARELGMDLLVTDHHECQEQLPDAVAVIDPKRPDSAYPFKELAGVGVAFKLICAVEGPGCEEALLDTYGDLVAMGTVADIMPLLDENRIFVRRGLALMRQGCRPGIDALMTEAGVVAETISAENIGFSLAPRINAAGRMGTPMIALDLLRAASPEAARDLAARLSELNRQRQQTEGGILDEAIAMLTDMNYEQGPIVLASPDWHKGVLGIVAARLMRLYDAPTVLIQIDGDEGRGSCRSPDNYNLFEALLNVGDCLTAFGGHEAAAGLSLPVSQIDDLREKWEEYDLRRPPREEGGGLEIDFSLPGPGLVSMDAVRALDDLAPFGKGNPVPVLCLESARLAEIRPMGGNRHVRLTLEKWGRAFEGVFFSTAPDTLPSAAGDLVDLAFTPQINTFRGRSKVQFLVKDIRPVDPADTSTLAAGRRVLCAGADGNRALTDVRPDREDFVRLYRYLAAMKDGALSGPAEAVMTRLEAEIGDGWAARYYVCLKVMEEMGLAALTETEETLSVRLHPNPPKVDLEASVLLRTLDGKDT